MTKQNLGAVMLAALIAGTLLVGVILIAFDVSNFDDFRDVLKSIWSAFLGLFFS